MNVTKTHIAWDETGSFDEGAAEVVEVLETGARQVTEWGTQKQTEDQSDLFFGLKSARAWSSNQKYFNSSEW